MSDSRDLAIETLAHEVIAAEQAHDAYRELLCLALQQLHDVAQQLRQQREHTARLADQYRALREQTMRRAA